MRFGQTAIFGIGGAGPYRLEVQPTLMARISSTHKTPRSSRARFMLRLMLSVGAGQLVGCSGSSNGPEAFSLQASPPYKVMPPTEAPAPTRQTLAQGLYLDAALGEVHVDCTVSITEGLLEQVACLQGTRDHEVLVTTQVEPSAVHGALLLLGARSGTPGTWSWHKGALALTPPTGTAVEVFVVVGDEPPLPIAAWMRSARGEQEGSDPFPLGPWRFSGSNFVTVRDIVRNDQGDIVASREHEMYEADQSGSLVGIVTFGDETLAWPEVLPHQEVFQDVLWEAAGDRMPPVGTPVTLVLRP